MISGSFTLGLLEYLVALNKLTFVSDSSLHANYRLAISGALLAGSEGEHSPCKTCSFILCVLQCFPHW